MKLFNTIQKYKNLFEIENNREINLYKFENCYLTGNTYLNTYLVDINNNIWNPVDEKIMSLLNYTNDRKLNIKNTAINNIEYRPVFFFIYNTHNYYHFLYDTIPYLISYKELKKEIKNLKLLVSDKDKFIFFYDVLELLGIKKDDLIVASKDTIYKQIFISDSYTHGIDSNLEPRKEVYNLFQFLSKDFILQEKKKIYVSRRTWINKDLSNIGTDYTNRRKMINEDDLVRFLINQGYTEIFTESLSMTDKINLFKNSNKICGPIGGGLVNVLFCEPGTKVDVIVSPCFLDINNRFKFLFKNLNVNYVTCTSHIEQNKYKKYMRVQYNNIVGEIIETNEQKSLIEYSDENISGWIKNESYNKIYVENEKLNILDNGLNSLWKIDLDKFKKEFKNE